VKIVHQFLETGPLTEQWLDVGQCLQHSTVAFVGREAKSGENFESENLKISLEFPKMERGKQPVKITNNRIVKLF
jgi:hypothetical protein